jgi:hypothetical protein
MDEASSGIGFVQAKYPQYEWEVVRVDFQRAVRINCYDPVRHLTCGLYVDDLVMASAPSDVFMLDEMAWRLVNAMERGDYQSFPSHEPEPSSSPRSRKVDKLKGRRSQRG